jgi:predicted transcriptional regulator
MYLGQEDVAWSAQLTTAAYARIERANTNPTYTTVVRICKALELEINFNEEQ